MNCLATYTDNFLRFYTRKMILNVESDAEYLVFPKSQNRAAAWFIFGNNPSKVSKPMTNSPIHVMCNKIQKCKSSTPEAETSGIYMGGQWSCSIRISAI